jgi:hypothetical protein
MVAPATASLSVDMVCDFRGSIGFMVENWCWELREVSANMAKCGDKLIGLLTALELTIFSALLRTIQRKYSIYNVGDFWYFCTVLSRWY